MTATAATPSSTAGRLDGYAAALARARAARRPLLDLTESSPARSGLGWVPAVLNDLLAGGRAVGVEAGPAGQAAREAVSRYLADRGQDVPAPWIVFAPTTRRAHAAVLSLLCRPGDAVLVPGSGAPFPHRLAARLGVEPIRYRLRHEGAWQLDRRELERAVTERTRAVVVASPSAPTGARLSARELAWLERLCAERRLALVGDESYADAATGEGPGVCEVTRCLGVHVSGLSTVCGLPRLPSWVALAGPAVEAGRAASRLETILGAPPGVALRALRVTPALLAARQHFLGPLARRLGENRALLARSALGEASFSVDQGGGGWWAVLHLGAAHEGEEVCRSLLTEDVVLRPWLLEGLPRHGYVVVSLLTPPDVLHQGLERLERHLRRPMF